MGVENSEYHRVVHLDMDCLVLCLFDELFNRTAEVLYTEDWLMANHDESRARAGRICCSALCTLARSATSRLIATGAASRAGRLGHRLLLRRTDDSGYRPALPRTCGGSRPRSSNGVTYNNMADNPYFKEDDELCRDR